MAKMITLNYQGVEYTLEYTRKSIEQMEKSGFNVDDIDTKPMTTLPALFAGAFLAHHRFVKRETVDEIFSKIANKADFLEKLAEMYNEPLEAMLDDPETTEGNAEWGASF